LEVRTVGLGVVGNLFNGISGRLDCTINKRELVVMVVEYFPEPDEPKAWNTCDRCGDEIFNGETVVWIGSKIYCHECYEIFEVDEDA